MMKKSSSLENEPCCSKNCKKNTDSLNSKIEDLKSKLSDFDIYGYSYKLGVDQLEGRLAEYKEREVKYIETIRTLEMDKEYYLRKIKKLTSEVEALQEEKDVVDGKLARLLKSSKDLEDIIESQRKDDEQSGRTITITTEDMQRKKNDVKERTTLLLSLPDDHQLRFSKYKTAKELWAAILKTFGGNETTKKRKKNLLKQQYGNLKAEGSETLEQTFNRLQVINMAFISSSKHSSGDEDGNTTCVSTSSTTFPTASASAATISQDTASAYIVSQSSDNLWKRTGKKISIQGSDVAGFDKSKVECFNCHKMGHFARECRAPISQERGRKENYRQGSKAEEKTPKALMAIYGVGWDWSYMTNEGEDHALVADAEAPTKFALMANTESKRSDKVKDGVGYNAVPPAAADLYLSPKKDLSWTGRPEFVDDTVTYYSRPSPTVESTSIEGPEFVLKKKACFNCGNFSHFSNKCRKRVQRETTRSQNHAYMSPSHRSAGHRPHGASMRPSHRPTGHRPHGPSMNPMRPNMNGAIPNRLFSIQAHSYETRPFFKSSAVKTQYRAPWVPTVNRNNPPVNRKFSTGRRNFPTVNRKFPTASRKFTTGSIKIHTADMGRKGKAIKPSACWVWNPSQSLSNKSLINNSVSVMFKKYTYIDTQGRLNGCSRHMTGNISYLSDFEPFDGGYVSFGQRGCKIIGKGTIKTGKLEFENVYFVKDLKYNMFSVPQICDNKNSVLFTDSKCIVLGRNFKLLDDANILFRTPR
nr:ribonuclease H-like domain-containing protein [Tanacetum cinerariifolium]